MLDGEKVSPWRRQRRRGGRLICLVPAVATLLFSAASHVCASDEGNPFPAFQAPETPPVTETLPVKPKTLPAPPVSDQQPAPPVTVPQIPIGLDTVLRLAEQQNAKIAIARAKVDEAFADQNVAKYKWQGE